jgi:hypothetical protein
MSASCFQARRHLLNNKLQSQMKKKLDTMGTGTGKGLSSSREPITDARNIARLADAGAKRFARKLEAESGRVLEPCEVEETAAIHRAELARVYALGARIPETDMRGYSPALWAAKCGVSRLGRKYRLYRRQYALCRRAMRRAGKRSRSHIYGGGAEEFTFIPFRTTLGPLPNGDKASLQTQAAFIAGESGLRSAWAAVSGATNSGGERMFAREWTRERMRGEYHDDRLRLAVYWARKGGQRWETALDDGLRFLGAIYQSMSGRGCSGLLALGYSVEAASRRADRDKLTKAVAALRAKVRGGEYEIRNNPQSVSNTLHYLELIADTPAVKCRETVARLRSRLVNLAAGNPPAVNRAADCREAAADRVARRRNWQRLHGVGLWGREGQRASVNLCADRCSTVIPGVRVLLAKSKAVAGYTLQVETLPSDTAEIARRRAFRVNAYASQLIARSEARRAFGCVW